MDMQHTIDITILPEECDEHGFIKPKCLINRLVDATQFRNKLEGGGKVPLRQKFNAVWMIRRLKFEQFKPVKAGTELNGFASGRTRLTESYVWRGEYYSGNELVARMDYLLMPVEFDKREKVSLDAVNTLYTTEPSDCVPSFDRLPMYKGLDYPQRKKVHPEDCDSNEHFASANYSEMICKRIGYYDIPGQTFKSLQMDFIREITVGKVLKLSIRQKNGGYSIQGKHMSGFPCFNAFCELN